MDKGAIDFLDAVSSVNDETQLKEALLREVNDLGFETFTYAFLRRPNSKGPPIFITTYPHAWVERYCSEHYEDIDPIFAAAASEILPIRWDAVYLDTHLTGRERVIFEEGLDGGLGAGVTVPIHRKAGEFATLSVAGCQPGREFEEVWRRNRHRLHLVGLHYHAAFARLRESARSIDIRLSPRERECLLWTARGKTASEVGDILGISGNTVAEYLQYAARKLGVFNKQQAVVDAILQGLINP
jgi:DNA-binding CsgD family transcriptional regulator